MSDIQVYFTYWASRENHNVILRAYLRYTCLNIRTQVWIEIKGLSHTGIFHNIFVKIIILLVDDKSLFFAVRIEDSS